MSEAMIKYRWLNWVMHGEGKSSSSMEGGDRYSYRDKVLFSHTWPVARLIKAKDSFVCLSRTGVQVDWNVPAAGKIDDTVTTIHVPDIGVFTHYEGDMLTEDALHDRMRWLCHLQAQELLNKARVWPDVKLFENYSDKELTGLMANVVQLYDSYNLAFKLGWVRFRDYGKELKDILGDRRRRYTDPVAVAKRERTKARRAAKDALGLNE